MGSEDRSELVAFKGQLVHDDAKADREVKVDSTYYHGLIYQPDCHLCPLRHQRKVLPDGPIPAKRVLIGEGPGEREEIEGRGFVGPSGALLWYLDEAVGTPPREQSTWVTNAALCRPRRIKLTTGASLSVTEVKAMSIRACRRRLIWEIIHVTGNSDDAVLQPLGNWALWAIHPFIPNPKIYANRGSVQKVDLMETAKAAEVGAICEALLSRSSNR